MLPVRNRPDFATRFPMIKVRECHDAGDAHSSSWAEEMALMRRAVERLATEKAEIAIPDYTATLGEIAQTLAAVADNPAIQLTPEDLAARMDAAATKARQKDRDELQQSHSRFDQASRDLRSVVRSARTADELRRHLSWAMGGGLAAGIILWSFLPGTIARTVPASWHWPEAMAVRTLRKPTIWEEGAQLMRVGSPPTFEALREANEILRDNREAIDRCRQEAAGTEQPVRCTIHIKAPPRDGQAR